VAFVVEAGQVTMRGLKSIPAEQSWFWTNAWQTGEREASDQIAAGEGTVFDNGDASSLTHSVRLPTYQRLPRFDEDWRSLGSTEQQRFRTAVARFVEDLESGRPFRAELRVEGVQEARDVMEMTFAPDGRATWEFGAEVKVGPVQVIWRRIGTHDIFRAP